MADNVYKGFWINWDEGRIKGATLTLPTYEGLILVSFLTLFVQFSGGCFWRVICFILHQIRSTTTNRDGLFHQQQAILRNTITAPNALWALTKAACAWKPQINSAWRHSLPLLLITLVHFSAFALAGLFSSQVTTTTAGEALAIGKTCGFPKELTNPRTISSFLLDPEALTTFNSEVLLGRLALTKSASYVRTCYKDQSTSAASGCNLWVQPYLQGTNHSAVSNASCPFGSNACLTPAVRYDSGVLKSNHDIGINSRKDESLSMRRVTTCAPINANHYATQWQPINETLGSFQNSAKYYEFGTSDATCKATTQHTNMTTFCLTTLEKQTTNTAYILQQASGYYNNKTASDFAPIADFYVDNADTALVSIFNNAQYVGNISDPLFLAQNQSSKASTFYTATNDLGVLGCTEQYQFCNVGNGKCTALTGLYAVQQAVDQNDLALSTQQEAIFTVMWKAAWSMAFQWTIEILGDDILLARDWTWTTSDRTSSPLSEDQWQLEAQNLHNISLAMFQRRINEFAVPVDFEIRPGLGSFEQIDVPTDPLLKNICAMQKVRSSDHYSVSVVGMAVILIIGSLLILLDMFLVRQIFWFRSLGHYRLAKKADWISTGTLQLHRQALEAKGVGPWRGVEDDFPVLAAGMYEFPRMGGGVEDGARGQVVDEAANGGHWSASGQSQDTTYGGAGGYSKVPLGLRGDDTEMHILADQKR